MDGTQAESSPSPPHATAQLAPAAAPPGRAPTSAAAGLLAAAERLVAAPDMGRMQALQGDAQQQLARATARLQRCNAASEQEYERLVGEFAQYRRLLTELKADLEFVSDKVRVSRERLQAIGGA
eukprot:EG_transcript_35665